MEKDRKAIFLWPRRFTPEQIAALRAELKEHTGIVEIEAECLKAPLLVGEPKRPRQNQREERRARRQHFREIQREHGRRR